MITKTLLASLIALTVTFTSSGCSQAVVKQTIPQSIFQEKVILGKPFEIQNENQMLEEYLRLYEAYRKNLNLIETIENLQGVSKEQ